MYITWRPVARTWKIEKDPEKIQLLISVSLKKNFLYTFQVDHLEKRLIENRLRTCTYSIFPLLFSDVTDKRNVKVFWKKKNSIPRSLFVVLHLFTTWNNIYGVRYTNAKKNRLLKYFCFTLSEEPSRFTKKCSRGRAKEEVKTHVAHPNPRSMMPQFFKRSTARERMRGKTPTASTNNLIKFDTNVSVHSIEECSVGLQIDKTKARRGRNFLSNSCTIGLGYGNKMKVFFLRKKSVIFVQAKSWLKSLMSNETWKARKFSNPSTSLRHGTFRR